MKINRSIQFIGRFITSIIILGITAFFTPGFDFSNIWILAVAIFSLTFVDFIIGCFTHIYFHPYIKFIIGVILSAIALYSVQYFFIGYILSYIPIVLGSIVFGLVDFMLPNEEHIKK